MHKESGLIITLDNRYGKPWGRWLVFCVQPITAERFRTAADVVNSPDCFAAATACRKSGNMACKDDIKLLLAVYTVIQGDSLII